MSVKQLTLTDLCRRLADGWTSEHVEVPRELFARLSTRCDASFDSESLGHSTYSAILGLNKLRFLGASELGCLLLGAGASVEREVSQFWERHGGGGRLAVIITASSSVKEAARQAVPSEHCVFLVNGELEALLGDPQPLERLKHHIRSQVPLRRLLPYDTTHPVAPNMFFGHRDLLDRFHNEETTSFAIAGPGRIGKSSLLKQYAYELRWNAHDDRRSRLFHIDCYPYRNLDADDLARRFALDISADSEANRINYDTLLRFLRRHSHDGQRPLELLLDEVDTVCTNPTFHQQLGEAIKCSYCRVILCGKGALHRMMEQGETHFAQRLILIRPVPLDGQSATRLFIEPLEHMGFELPEVSLMLPTIFEMTSRRPQLIQDCARRLVELALREKTSVLTMHQLDQIREGLRAEAYATLPLDDMQDDVTRLVVLLWLRAGGGKMTVKSVQDLAQINSISLTASEALNICQDLWICNVLTSERGVFALANPHLVEFVRRMDFSSEIARLKHRLVRIPNSGINNQT